MKKHEWYKDIETNKLYMFLEPAGSKRSMVRVYDQHSDMIRDVSRAAWEFDIESKRLIKSKGDNDVRS